MDAKWSPQILKIETSIGDQMAATDWIAENRSISFNTGWYTKLFVFILLPNKT